MLRITKVKPMFNNIITTAEKYEDDYRAGGLYDPNKQKGSLKEYQTVVAVGAMVKGIEVGDKVMIDPTRYAVLKHEKDSLKDGVIKDNPVVGFNFKTVLINDIQHLILFDTDVKYVFDGEETPDEPEPLVQVIKNDILPTT